MSANYDVIFSVSLLPGYQKSTQTIWMCHIVYFNNVKRNLGHLSCTLGPPQPKDYFAAVDILATCCKSVITIFYFCFYDASLRR